MGSSMYGDDDSSAGWRSLTKSLEPEVAMDNPEKPRSGVLDPSRGTYRFKYRPPSGTRIIQLVQSSESLAKLGRNYLVHNRCVIMPICTNV
ncbi:hypothetical protein Zmor_013251 [Zophobas morio]|uniref:Uncharacterized protein n=1 Tax=Zophobas morio TaxID=2755281 RepID=A0AA38MF08_9CUCU|nr:hypothetical protein Zmor_013251 [Zophobas morio]